MRKSPLMIGLLTLSLLAGCAQPKTPSQSSTPAESTATKKKATSVKRELVESPKITFQKARQIYQQEYPHTAIKEVELKRYGGQTIYEISGLGDNEEYHMHIDAATGETSRLVKETLDSDEQNGREREAKRLAFDRLITLDKAISRARQYFSGELVKWSLEKDDGLMVWEFEGYQDQQTVQVKLNAETGALIEKENDD